MELNKWPQIETIGSCCGHGHSCPFVLFNVHNTRVLRYILKPLRDPNLNSAAYSKFRIVISDDARGKMKVPFRDLSDLDAMEDGVMLTLSTYTKGAQAYKELQDYTESLIALREKIYGKEVEKP